MRDLTTGNETRLIVRFALPMLAGNVFQNLYNIIDSVIVGNYLGKEALAAVGASFPVIFTLIALVIGVGSGASIVISQFFGAKKQMRFDAPSTPFSSFLSVQRLFLPHWASYFLNQFSDYYSYPKKFFHKPKRIFTPT